MNHTLSRWALLILTLNSLALGATAGAAQDDASRPSLPEAATFQVSLASGPVNVDGIMNEPAWDTAVRFPLPYEWFPGDNVTPPVETECWVTYDISNFYFACHAFDPNPSAIRAHYADRDDLGRTTQDDHFVILLDPFNDERRGFQFRVNPLGVQMDAILSTAEGFEDFSWDAIWRSAGRITDDGYVVEVAIPFRSLRFPRTHGPQTWGFFAERSYPRSNRHRMRSMPTDRNNSCLLCQANKLVGFEGITPGNNVEIAPTATSSRTDERSDFPTGAITNGDIEVDPGVDLRWGVTPNLSLNATGNPDFSQVEADVAQLDVNTRFALFFPEKRPFFLEGADFFVTPIQAVFTRTVADPAAGIKLTGKAGSSGLGVFVAHDRITNLVFPANQGSLSAGLEQNATTGVVRYRRDLGRASYVGLLYTGREGKAYHNRLGGLDGFVQISPTNSLRLQYLVSDTEYPDSIAVAFGQPTQAFVGGGLRTQFLHFSRNWFANLTYQDLSPDFRADVGFEPRVDVRIGEGSLTRIFWGPRGGWFTRLGIGVEASRTVDHQGALTDQSLTVSASYLGPSQTNIHLVLSQDKERLGDVEHDLTRGGAFFQIRPSGSVTFGIFGQVGDELDVANNRTAFNVLVGPSAQVSIGRPITVNLSHLLQRLSLGGNRIFTANLFQSRFIYHFNVRTFIRAIIQFQDVDRNPALYGFAVEENSRRLFTQFLFSYKVNPQTVAFLGYSDTRLGTSDVSLTQAGRTFFMKLGYAWRP